MGRTPCCNEEGLKKGAWTADEDQKLIAYIQQHGEGGWRTLPQKAGLQRCGKSCRLRWANYLRPDIKRGQFSTEEEQKIIQLHSTLGNRWSAIARHLPKRTDNEIKNYWNTHIKKRLVEMGIDPVTRMQIGPSPSSSNDNSTNVNVTEDSTHNVDSEIRPIERSISASAKLLNKVSAKFALMQRQDMASAPSHSLDAFKAVLINSTKDSGLSRGGGGGGGNGSGGNDSDIEMLVSTSVPLKKRFPSQILNKMASKLAASKSFDMLKNRLGDAANSTNVNVACNSNSSTGSSYNNIESPNISISDFFEKTTSSTCESSEFNENLFYIEEDEINEAFAKLHYAVGLESNPSSPMCEYVGNCGAEEGAIFTDSMKENMADDCQVGINMEFNNFENSTNFIERFTNMPFGGSPIEYTSTNYYYGEGESHGENPQENLNYWNQDFDLLNYAIP